MNMKIPIKYKTLKIAIVQFHGDNNTAICKITITIDNKNKQVFEHCIDINFNIQTNTKLTNLINKYNLLDEMIFVVNKAKLQMEEKRQFGIDTYWKWDDKGNKI